ncbi:MAG: hypothetical protein WC635_13825 [Bacteriovorax sp.]|jgi:DNA-binding transcriptional regulator/RsmH inhibitor MraZ
MKTYFVLIFFFALSEMAFPSCIEGKIKIIDGKKETLTEDRYCFDELLRSISSTKKCPDDKECFINLPGPHLLKGKEAKKNICLMLNGVSQDIEFWDKEKWVKTSRCLFSDGSYIDNESLKLKVKLVE